MWQKVSLWYYIHEHYADDFEYIHLCCDHTYVFVDNLQQFLSLQQSNKNEPMHAGQRIRRKNLPHIVVDPAFINRATLQRFVEADDCHADTTVSVPWMSPLLSI